MSTVTIFGAEPDEAILQKNYPVTTQDSSGQWTMEFEYVVRKDIAYDSNVVPDQNTSVPPQFAIPEVTPGLILLGKTYTPNDMPGYLNLRLNYALPQSESVGSPKQPGDETKEASTTFREVPVENAIDPETDDFYPAAAVTAAKASGDDTKAAFQSQYILTTVEKTGVINEAELIVGVGMRSTPTGLSNVGSTYSASKRQNRWLKTSIGINTIQGGNRQVREEWTYSENWNEILYVVDGA